MVLISAMMTQSLFYVECNVAVCDHLQVRMGMNGLTTGVENDIVWSNIRSDFVEPDGTPPPRIPMGKYFPSNFYIDK